MDPLTLSFLGAGASLVARLFGEALAAGDIDKAMALKEQAVAEFGPDILPQLEEMTPQTISRSAMADLQTDPAGRQAQLAALGKLADFASGDFLPEDAAEQRRVMDQAAGVGARQAAAGEQLAAARGLRSSSLSQALGQQAAQAGAQQASDIGAQLAAQRRQRQLQALSMQGGLGGSLRGADFSEGARRADAQDALNRFNANMTADALESRNRAKLARYDAEMRLKGARNAARGELAGAYAGRAAANKGTAMDIGAGMQGGMQTGADYLERDPRKKGGR